MRQYVREKSSNAGLTPYFDPAGVTARGRLHRRLPAQVADRRVPVPRQPDDVPGDHPAGRDRCAARWLGQERDDRHRPVPRQELRRQEERGARPPTTTYWGGRPPLDGVRVTFYQGSAPIVLALRGGQIDLAMQLSPQEGQPFKNNSRYTYYAAADLGAPAGLHADRPGPAHGRTGPPGARARDQPAAAARASDARRRADRQRQRRSGAASRRPIGRSSSARRTSTSRGRCCGQRAPRT